VLISTPYFWKSKFQQQSQINKPETSTRMPGALFARVAAPIIKNLDKSRSIELL